MISLKQRLRNGEQVLGTMVATFASPDIGKILKGCGFDFFIIDCEHGSFTTREVANIIAVARGAQIPALVRMLVDCAKYAPLGHRGVSLSRPHTDFARVSGAEYMPRANDETLLMCQIESRRGVENIEAILAVEGIDVGFIGPNDMTQDYGILGQFEHPDIVAAFERVIAAARANGKWSGVHFGSAAPLAPWLSRGMQINMCGSDNGLLALGAAAMRRQLEGGVA